MKDPTVSVIIPVYNREDVITRAIDSVLNQTYDSFELIVVDDGSTDGTPRQLSRYQTKDRIRVFRQSNKGANAARNHGLQVARGTYVAFLDSDDRWYSNKLERQVHRIKRTPERVGIVHCAFWAMNGLFRQYKPQGKPDVLEGDLSDELLKHNFLGFINTLIKTSIFQKTGPLDEDLPALQDWDFHLTASRHTRYAFMTEPLLEKYPQETSISRDYDAYVQAHKRLYRKHHRRFKKNKQGYANLQFRTGSCLCLIGSSTEGRQHIRNAVQIKPGNFVFRLAYLVSYFGRDLFRFTWSLHSYMQAVMDLLHHVRSSSDSSREVK